MSLSCDKKERGMVGGLVKVTVSIIIPCYNIKNRIDSLLQMLDVDIPYNYEVILIDDCSTDETYTELLKKFEGKDKFIILQTEQNGGPGVARNYGLLHASGEFVMFCDSDDEVDITALNCINSFFAEHEDADLLVFPYSIKRKGKISFCDEFMRYKQGDMVRVVDVAADSGTPCAKVYRKHIIDDNNIQFPIRKLGEDKCFVVKFCTFIDKVFKVDCQYYTYVMNRFSLTHRKQREQEIVTTFEILQPIYRNYFPEIVERMYVETFLLTYAKHFSAINVKNKEIMEFYKIENGKYPNWINNVDYENQSLYRKLIYKAMYKNCPMMIKLIMWIRRKVY